MKKIISFLIIASCLSTQAWFWTSTQNKQAAQPDYFTECQDVLKQLEAGAPYKNPNDATYAAILIEVAASKQLDAPGITLEQVQKGVLSQEDKNAIEEKRKNAERIVKCAEHFRVYGGHYTSDTPLREFLGKFDQTQLQNPTVTKEDFLKQHIEQEYERMDEKQKLIKNTCDDLYFLAKVRTFSEMARPAEKEAAKNWMALFEKCATKAAAQPVTAQAPIDVDKYLK